MSSSHELVCIFKVFNQRSNLRFSYQSPLEGTLAASIILLMCLVDGDCREDPVGLLNREIASIEFFGNIWVSRW